MSDCWKHPEELRYFNEFNVRNVVSFIHSRTKEASSWTIILRSYYTRKRAYQLFWAFPQLLLSFLSSFLFYPPILISLLLRYLSHTFVHLQTWYTFFLVYNPDNYLFSLKRNAIRSWGVLGSAMKFARLLYCIK